MTTESIVDKILSSFIDNKVIDKTFLSAVLMVNQIEIVEYQLLELYNEIVDSDLFDYKDASTKDGKDLLFIPNNKAKRIYAFYGSYSNFKNKKELTENEIIDLVFDNFHNQKKINIDYFLRSNHIYLNDNQLDRIYEIIKSTNFVNDKSFINNSKRKIVFEFNGLGMRTLKNKKFSQYEDEINKPNSLIITNSDLKNVNLNQGLLSNDSLTITQNVNNAPIEKEIKQSAMAKLMLMIKKYWWGILIPIIISIIILMIEYKSGYFIIPN